MASLETDENINLEADLNVRLNLSEKTDSKISTSESVKVSHGKEYNHPKLDSSHGSPRRGPTLSTSTSSFEALDPHDPNLSHLASLMFSQTSNYLQVGNNNHVIAVLHRVS